MSSESVIVWDLETVPDLKGFAAARNLVDRTAEELRLELGDRFPKHIYHAIVCIGALVATREPTHWHIAAVGAPHIGERPEAQLIKGFVDRIAELRPQLVTFNGNSFDLPVLRYRAMLNKVQAPGLFIRPYFSRYSEAALDLCDVLSSFSSGGKATLDEISKIMGLPGKPGEISGKDVERYFLDGRIRDIANYCESDVVNTYRIWLRHEHFRGTLSGAEYEASEADLRGYIAARPETKLHLA